jgi:hypothetical protein
MVGALLRHGADPTLANRDGSTPLSLVRNQLELYDSMIELDGFYEYYNPRGSYEDVEQRLVAALREQLSSSS